jgi:hypothetical protein
MYLRHADLGERQKIRFHAQLANHQNQSCVSDCPKYGDGERSFTFQIGDAPEPHDGQQR